ncbi:MAG: DUF397 domain-containing protein [Pseudonocardiaceae bacterium]
MGELTRRAWRKSTYTPNTFNCVEFAEGQDGCAVRDSKDPTGPALMFTTGQWSAFTTGLRAGEFD